MSEDGRIYARWNGAFVETGRLSCRDPNLTTIPARDEEAKDIKKAFVASDGYIILGEDYSQIEPWQCISGQGLITEKTRPLSI